MNQNGAVGAEHDGARLAREAVGDRDHARRHGRGDGRAQDAGVEHRVRAAIAIDGERLAALPDAIVPGRQRQLLERAVRVASEPV